jgi:hypothetical protein
MECIQMNFFTKTLAAAVAVVGFAAGASAATFKVEVWDIPGSGIVADLTAAEGFGPPAAADAIYASSNINFGDGDINTGAGFFINDGGTPRTVTNFLNGASFISGDANLTIERTLMRITGQALFQNGTNYAILSDDGYQLTIGGTQISRVENRQAPGGLNGAGGSEFFTFGQATGVYDIELIWFEGQNTQVQLAFVEADGTNIDPVPLPAAAWMLLAGIGGLGVMGRRRAKA